MTRKECLEKLENMERVDLVSSAIFFLSPITNMVEVRDFYSSDFSEVHMWLQESFKFYVASKIPALGYINGVMQMKNDSSRMFEE